VFPGIDSMKHQAFLALMFAAGLLASAVAHAAPPAPATSPARPPNIVFILADDLGYGDVGCFGQEQIKTPRIDQMARDGMRFTDFYAGSTVCAPSRCVLMTGLHIGHAPIRGNSGGTNVLPKDMSTIAAMLKDRGYATGLIGKWGLGAMHSGSAPPDKGFDYSFGFLSQTHAHNYYPEWLVRNGQRVTVPGNELPEPKRANGSGVAIKRVTYAPDLFQQEALNFIDQHKSEPFFLYYATTIPHANDENHGHGSEVPSPGQYGTKDWPENERAFAAMITLLDTQVGQILDRLKVDGLDENTLVVFTSDNGPHNEGGHDAKFFHSSGPLRGIKRDLYEGGVRVPMIARWPGQVKAGSETPHVAYFGDFFATAADLSGGKMPAGLDSLSFAPTMLGRGDQASHESLYWEFYERQSSQAVRFGNWKAVRTPMLTGKIELYDLATDLGEQYDVAADHADLVKRAAKLMEKNRTKDPNWVAPSEETPEHRKAKRNTADE
jgi:arylsulfatase A-like enzyme